MKNLEDEMRRITMPMSIGCADKKRGKAWEGSIYFIHNKRKDILAKVYSDDSAYMRRDRDAIRAYMENRYFHNRTGYKDLTKHAETYILVLRILGSADFFRVVSKSCLKMLLKREIIKFRNGQYYEPRRPKVRD